MLDISTLLRLFLVGFALNIVWEFLHCQLYETCRRQTWAKNIPLLLKMSLKDGFFIVLFSSITSVLWRTDAILHTPTALITFLILALSFSGIDEKISIKKGRWEYAAAMPTVFGVGVTPLLEIAVTGVVAMWLL